MSEGTGRMGCPFCGAYEVDRLYLATVRLDACVCGVCGARWDERTDTGEFAGRGSSATVVRPRRP